ncbi:hypothetical protein KY285_001989 [Solanum tuberosum]|nr:hypothetical protein KY285_001989 [Solanum tuberosum]
MSERLPLPWLLQMSIYNVKIGGENVITRVADRETTMSHGISELRHDMKADPNPIVGIDVVNSVVDVGYLAAQIRKKPRLLTSTLEELMLEVDVEIMRPIIGNSSLRHKWESSAVLSEEEVKVAMYEVYSCYQIATKVIEVMQTGATTRG